MGAAKHARATPAFLMPTLRLLQGAECNSTLMGGVGRERLGRTGTPGGPRVLGSSEPLLRGEGGERHHACGDLQNMLQHPSRFHIAKCRLRDEITENSNRWSWHGNPQAAGLFLSLNHMHGSVSLGPALVWIVQPLEAVTPACPGDLFIGCP